MEAEAPQGLHELLTRGALYRARAVRGQREGSGQAVGRRCRGGAGAVRVVPHLHHDLLDQPEEDVGRERALVCLVENHGLSVGEAQSKNCLHPQLGLVAVPGPPTGL